MRGKVCRSIPKRIKEWDHPRICGEKESKLQEIEDISGSPPHMRGKVATGRQTVCRCGITPAYAGKSVAKCGAVEEVGDHPRICGEKYSGLFEQQNDAGITPAYAGKSGISSQAKPSRRDHPRVCGEKVPAIRRFAQIMGSPPRMRGKGHRIPLRHPLQGITPAYAGKSSACRRTLSAGWDHPRICGEKAEMGGFIPRFSGSPPRMRGKVLPDRGRVLGVGITPAYAGKSFPTSMFRSVGRDHPRICGEKIVVSRTWCSRSGLPPRMRGKVQGLRENLERMGITPAYAGKSYPMSAQPES